MNNLSRQLESLFADLESKLPTFDDVDNDNDNAKAVNEDNEVAALESAYPVFYENLNLADEIDLAALELSPRMPELSPRPQSNVIQSHTEIVYDIESTSSTKIDAAVGDDTVESREHTPRNLTPRGGPVASHDNIPSYSFGSNGATWRSLIESQDLVDRYFPPTGVQLTTAGLEMDDLDRILECIDDSLDVEIPDCFQRAETMMMHPHHKTSGPPEGETAVILEKLIVHASKYDEGLKVKDFDLKSGSLKTNKKHRRHPKREKQECWTGDETVTTTATATEATDAPLKATSCCRGVTASFPLTEEQEINTETKPEPETVFVDLRLNKEAVEEKKRHVKRVQQILGLTYDYSSSDDDDK